MKSLKNNRTERKPKQKSKIADSKMFKFYIFWPNLQMFRGSKIKETTLILLMRYHTILLFLIDFLVCLVINGTMDKSEIKRIYYVLMEGAEDPIYCSFTLTQSQLYTNCRVAAVHLQSQLYTYSRSCTLTVAAVDLL